MAKPKGTSKRSPRTKRVNHVIKMITPIRKKSKINKKKATIQKASSQRGEYIKNFININKFIL